MQQLFITVSEDLKQQAYQEYKHNHKTSKEIRRHEQNPAETTAIRLKIQSNTFENHPHLGTM